MKPRTVLSLALLTLMVLGLSATAASQTNPCKAESYIHWQTLLRGEAADTWAMAEYAIVKPTVAPSPDVVSETFVKFSVEAVTPHLPDGSQLGVFLGPPTNPRDPYGVRVGVIYIFGGTGSMIQFASKLPTVRIGTTVTVADMHTTPGKHEVVLQGKF